LCLLELHEPMQFTPFFFVPIKAAVFAAFFRLVGKRVKTTAS